MSAQKGKSFIYELIFDLHIPEYTFKGGANNQRGSRRLKIIHLDPISYVDINFKLKLEQLCTLVNLETVPLKAVPSRQRVPIECCGGDPPASVCLMGFRAIDLTSFEGIYLKHLTQGH